MAGIADTLHLLAETANEAAVPVLVAALKTPDRRRPKQALQALLHRADPAAEMEVLARWQYWTEPMQRLVAEKPGWLSGVIHTALSSRLDSAASEELFNSACAAALFTRDYDQIPTLAAAAADVRNRTRKLPAETALLLAEMLFEELHAPRDYRVRRDPQLQRANLLPSLERMADTVDQHQRLELIEALLLLSERDSATIKRILQSPRDPSFPALTQVLRQSSRPGVMRLLLSYLDDPHAPRSALETLASRRDLQFIRQLLRKIGHQPPPVVRTNLHRIEEVSWLCDASAVFGALSESEQAAAIQLASEANLVPSQALQILSLGLQDGSPEGRRAAATGLVRFSGAEADEIAWQALDDEDPVVRAQAVTRMGKHATPTVIPRLLDMLDSPHQLEREAAQACLDEYNFERYLLAYDTMAPETKQATGLLVKKVDATMLSKLTTELQATIRTRRTRAIEIAVMLDLVPELFDALVPLLADEDQYTRLDAVRALAHCELGDSQQALRRAVLDHSTLVSQAAEEALARFQTLHEETAIKPAVATDQPTDPEEA
jgi:HEAT repeat protein